MKSTVASPVDPRFVDDDLLLCTVALPATPSSDEEADRMTRRRLTMRKHRAKRKTQLHDLRTQTQALQLHLHALRERQSIQHLLNPPGPWYNLMLSEKVRCREAHAENDRLRHLAQQHLALSRTLSSLLEQPTLHTPLTSPRCLPSEADRRAPVMHAILDATYRKLWGAFVEARLIDATETTHHHAAQCTATGDVEFHTIVYHDTPHDLTTAVEGGWRLHQGALVLDSLDHLCRSVDEVDSCVTYVTGWMDLPDVGHFQRRVLCKRYAPSPTTCAIVCQSVEADDAMPFDASSPILTEKSWLLFEANGKGGTTVKFFQKQRPLSGTVPGAWVTALAKRTQAYQDAVHGYMRQLEPPPTASIISDLFVQLKSFISTFPMLLHVTEADLCLELTLAQTLATVFVYPGPIPLASIARVELPTALPSQLECIFSPLRVGTVVPCFYVNGTYFGVCSKREYIYCRRSVDNCLKIDIKKSSASKYASWFIQLDASQSAAEIKYMIDSAISRQDVC
ncbi:hypothetical protein SDRG_01117 [Saprolegnia diclina VS20]|uniref:START domain-containing protein n=1 Tax=Saprolegnia diclina (strain VS20) TaxID=1156394 RepID=T0QSK3_SAPDV|nr:hypothetical protein SDRG_01117 [Saprolegnia diclina VS20]EQC41139.1 hypothetical protein SDRG_01117 [Saprolegnia diclina VS20]|eukprot:XP_008604853.1 hypothetical protein SDRG_01117 [Saprolegnia diclina VS20]